MRKKINYKLLFLTGAFWNWIVASFLFIAFKPMLKFLDMTPFEYELPIRLAMALVFVYGIGYFYIYKDPGRNRNLVKLGIYGKTLVFILSVYYFIAGEIPFTLVVPGIVDLIFAGFFAVFLIDYKPE